MKNNNNERRKPLELSIRKHPHKELYGDLNGLFRLLSGLDIDGKSKGELIWEYKKKKYGDQ